MHIVYQVAYYSPTIKVLLKACRYVSACADVLSLAAILIFRNTIVLLLGAHAHTHKHANTHVHTLIRLNIYTYHVHIHTHTRTYT